MLVSTLPPRPSARRSQDCLVGGSVGAGGGGGVKVKKKNTLMFADIIPPPVPCATLTCEPQETRSRLIFEISSPAYPLRIEQVHDCRHVLRYADLVVVVEAEVVAPHGGDVVGLGGVRLGIVFCQEDALALEVKEVRVIDHLGEVLLFMGGRPSVNSCNVAREKDWRGQG